MKLFDYSAKHLLMLMMMLMLMLMLMLNYGEMEHAHFAFEQLFHWLKLD